MNAQRSSLTPLRPSLTSWGPKRGVVDQAVGLGHRVAQVGVLLHVRLDDAVDRVAHGLVLGQQLQRAVLDLLQDVGRPVGDVDLHMPPRLVDRGLVAGQAELLPGVDQGADHGVVGLGADVEVARVVPAADIEAGDVLHRLERRVGGRTLAVEVDVLVVQRRLQGVVAVARRRAGPDRPR